MILIPSKLSVYKHLMLRTIKYGGWNKWCPKFAKQLPHSRSTNEVGNQFLWQTQRIKSTLKLFPFRLFLSFFVLFFLCFGEGHFWNINAHIWLRYVFANVFMEVFFIFYLKKLSWCEIKIKIVLNFYEWFVCLDCLLIFCFRRENKNTNKNKKIIQRIILHWTWKNKSKMNFHAWKTLKKTNYEGSKL